MILGGSGGEICRVFDEESESEVKNLENLHPDLEIKEKQKETLKIMIFLYFPFFGGGTLTTGGSSYGKPSETRFSRVPPFDCGRPLASKCVPEIYLFEGLASRLPETNENKKKHAKTLLVIYF